MEQRVYVIDLEKVNDDKFNYIFSKDEEFMCIAEKQGSVYSLKGFENNFNSSEMITDKKVIRIINVKEGVAIDLINELRIARSNITCLLDKAWELGGCYSGEEEFENLNDIKDAREFIEKINNIESTYNK